MNPILLFRKTMYPFFIYLFNRRNKFLYQLRKIFHLEKEKRKKKKEIYRTEFEPTCSAINDIFHFLSLSEFFFFFSKYLYIPGKLNLGFPKRLNIREARMEKESRKKKYIKYFISKWRGKIEKKKTQFCFQTELYSQKQHVCVYDACIILGGWRDSVVSFRKSSCCFSFP